MLSVNYLKHSSFFIAVFLVAIISFAFSQNAIVSASENFALISAEDNTKTILEQKNANKYYYPASLTKVMTLYLVFEALENGKLKPNQKLKVSEYAASMPPSNMGLKKGDIITVKEAIYATSIRSANDAAVVLAEAVAGSEWDFAIKMTEKARRLGMKDTMFRNASGLHDPVQKTTAKDMLTLAMKIKSDFVEYYPLFAKSGFVYKGRYYGSHNRVTMEYEGADGLKTGYTRASGYNLISSVDRDGKNIIAVVLAKETAAGRDSEMMDLLDRSFKKVSFKDSALNNIEKHYGDKLNIGEAIAYYRGDNFHQNVAMQNNNNVKIAEAVLDNPIFVASNNVKLSSNSSKNRAKSNIKIQVDNSKNKSYKTIADRYISENEYF